MPVINTIFMKKIIIIFSLFIIAQSFIKAQDTSFTYYDINWHETSKDSAFFHRRAYKTDKDTWIAKGYYDDGHIHIIIEFNDKKLSEMNGRYVYYNKNGNIACKGEYLQNKQNGIWTYYYENGKIKNEVTLLNNIGNGKFVYYSENGNINEEGEYLIGKLNGYVTIYDMEGHERFKMKYENQNFTEVMSWDKDGKEINIKEDQGDIIIEERKVG